LLNFFFGRAGTLVLSKFPKVCDLLRLNKVQNLTPFLTKVKGGLRLKTIFGCYLIQIPGKGRTTGGELLQLHKETV
jgi:hypothetical protein